MSIAVQVDVDRNQLLEAIRRDCLTFFAFYIGDELTLEVPDFHVEIWEELLGIIEQVNHPDFLIGHLQKLFAVPREHSKSTLAKLAVILFMRYSVLSFTLYVSKTATIAQAACRDVVEWMKSPQEIAVYGSPDIIKKSETEGLWILDIYLANGFKKRIILRAAGAGHQVRGLLVDNKRPELIIMDDIEDLDTADNGPQQAKLDAWALGSLMKASARRSVRLFLGNMIRSSTLLARLAKDPSWNPTVFGSLVRDKETKELKPLWEGRWTVEALLAEYRSFRRIGKGHIWEAEMMNLSADDILTQKLDDAIIVPQVNPEEVTSGFICLDPAFGLKSWHDESAITVHVRKNGFDLPICVDSRAGRMSEEQIFDTLIELSYYWNLATWVIESVAAQRLLLSLFRLMLINRGMNPDVFTMIPVVAGKESKGSRITAFRQVIASKSYALSESMIELKLKLEEYSPDTKEHDDLCDSGAYGPIVWELCGSMIEGLGAQSLAGRLLQAGGTVTNLGENDVCSV